MTTDKRLVPDRTPSLHDTGTELPHFVGTGPAPYGGTKGNDRVQVNGHHQKVAGDDYKKHLKELGE